MVVELNKDLGLLRLGAVVPRMRVADVDFNIDYILASIKNAAGEGVQILAFPEMSVTGYTIGDLIQQQALLSKAKAGLSRLLSETLNISMLVVVGMPLLVDNKIFNCVVVINSGKILAVIPKSYLPSYKEYYENRWFAPGRDAGTDNIELCGQLVSFGTDILVRIDSIKSAVVGFEICEDIWVPLAPHEYQSLAGATVLINASASNEILGKADWRRTMVISESGRCLAAYCYVSSGIDESSNDLVYGGHALIAENGVVLEESARLTAGSQMVISDIDLERLTHDRQTQTSIHDVDRQIEDFRIIHTRADDVPTARLLRNLNPHPFVPEDPARQAERCREIFSMQVAALAKKLAGSHQEHLVIGVSGGLDSTLALLVAVKTMDFLNLSRQNVYAYTLPGFGTTNRTENNATKLCRALGVTFKNVNITKTCEKQLKDMDHDIYDEDIVFENVQARYRTEFLFNAANQEGGIVMGTGDLTEIALGWSTFAGDQIAHYDVNASIPKTLVRHLVKWVADEELRNSKASAILYDILDTPISPELLRPNGHHIQRSEDTIGPVELADFFLYLFIRYGMSPGKILFFANEIRKRKLFESNYTLTELNRWLESFIKRFFANQFKRTCLPEGPKVGSVSLSPRGDWRMPSDAEPALWLEDLARMYSRLHQNRH